MTPTNLWNFACQSYARPDVEQLCLTLQDDWQGDVVLLLWLSWLESEGHRLEADQWRCAQAHIHPWQSQVLKPLRQLRHRIKTDYPDRGKTTEACRQAVKAAELCAEQRSLAELEVLAEKWFGSSPQPPLKAGNNLQLYTHQLGLPKILHQQLVRCLRQAG